MNASSLQENVKTLIYQLEKEVQNLSEANCSAIIRLTEAIIHDLERLQQEYNRRLVPKEREENKRIIELEEEIGYLKELNTCQRMMMEDNLKYLRALEDKLNSSPTDLVKG